MAFTPGGVLLLATIVMVMMVVPLAAAALGLLTLLRARQARGSDGGAASPDDAHDRDRLLGGWGGWRSYGLLACSTAGAALSGSLWVYVLYRDGRLGASSQARADLQLTLPFIAGLGFFGGFAVGVVFVGLLTQLWRNSSHHPGVD
jgi:hypothetical protein